MIDFVIYEWTKSTENKLESTANAMQLKDLITDYRQPLLESSLLNNNAARLIAFNPIFTPLPELCAICSDGFDVSLWVISRLAAALCEQQKHWQRQYLLWGFFSYGFATKKNMMTLNSLTHKPHDNWPQNSSILPANALSLSLAIIYLWLLFTLWCFRSSGHFQ